MDHHQTGGERNEEDHDLRQAIFQEVREAMAERSSDPIQDVRRLLQYPLPFLEEIDCSLGSYQWLSHYNRKGRFIDGVDERSWWENFAHFALLSLKPAASRRGYYSNPYDMKSAI
jgi:hypothetical protein